MKKLLNLRALLMLLIMTLATNVWGEEVTFTLGSGQDITSNDGATKSGITITATDGTSNPNNWGGATYVRLQAGGTFVITPNSATITSIVLNCTSGYEKTWSASTGSAPVVNTTAHTVTWSGSTSSAITLTNTASAQARVSSIDVTYTSNGGSSNPTTYTVTVDNNIANGTVTADPTSAAAGATVTLTATPATGYEFGSWNVTDASSNAITVTDNKFTMPAADVNVSATFNEIQGGEEPSGDGTTYNFADMDNFSTWATGYGKKTTTFSDGAYVELASANKSTSTVTDCPVTKGGDVIFKAPEGKKIASLTFTCTQWGTKAQTITLNTSSDGTNFTATSTTSSNFVLSASDLTDVTAVKFTFSSKDNQVGIKSIKVTYADGSSTDKTTPTLSFANPTYNATMGENFTAPTLNNPQNVTVTYTSSEAGVATVDSESGSITLVGAGTTTITASYDGSESDTYNSNSASYQLVVAAAPAPALTTMDEIYGAATTAGSTAADCSVTFDNWVVSGVKNNNAYVTDNAGKGFIVYTSNHGFEVGDILSGTAACKVQLYNGSAELTALTSTADGLTVTKGGVATPITTIALASLSGANTGAVISYENLQYDGTDFSDGTTAIKPYNTFITLPVLISGKNYNVTGVYIQYKDTKEIAPRTEADIELVEEINNYVVTIENPANGTMTIKDGETIINNGDEVAEGTELTIECTPVNADYRFKNWQYKEGDAAWATRTTDFTYTMPSANVQFRANFEEIPVFEVTYISLGEPAGKEQVKEGNKIANAPSVSLDNWDFVGWTKNDSYVDSETSPVLFDEAISGPTTLYAVFSQGESGVAASASLTNEEICNNVSGSYNDGSITNTYGTWNYNAAKQGNVNKDGEYFLQLRNNATVSYLQIPEMSGNITSIVLGRVCNTSKAKYTGSIYFRSEKSNDADAIATATQGAALTDVTLTIPAGHKTGYIMVSGACRIESVTVNYATGGSKTYTITGPQSVYGTINFAATTGNGKYYATFSSDRAIKFDEAFINDEETCMASVKAYAITIVDGEIYRTDQYDVNNDGNYTYIPANTGILFEYILDEDSEFDGTVPFEYADAEAEYLNPVKDNMLMPAKGTETVGPDENETYKFYKLAYGDWENKSLLGFWYGAENGGPYNAKVGGAYLAVPVTITNAKSGFAFDDAETNGINSINANINVNEPIYNIAGQRVNANAKGILIQNGKKYLNK